MQAGRDTKARYPSPPSTPIDPDELRDRIADLVVEAATFTAPARVDETLRGWLGKAGFDSAKPGQGMELAAEAFALALNLALFTPSGGGTTPFDRLARQRRDMSAAEAAALASLRRAQLRLLRVERTGGAGDVRMRDLASNERLEVAQGTIRAEIAGMPIVGWLAPLGDGRYAFAGAAVPLDEAAFAVAAGFVRPGQPALAPPLRCAEAVYRHVVRHGTLAVPGLNRAPEGPYDDLPEDASELDLLAMRWAQPDAARDPDDMRFVRSETELGTILAMLASAAATREHGLPALSDAYAAIAQIQLETVRRRASAGSGSLRLETVAAALDAAVAAGEFPPGTRDVFQEVRRRLGATQAPGGKDAELDRLIGRIQALRSKTVEQGCTEQEALAAAEKVAELLDRYGLSLSELDLRQQACEGSAVETDRKRAGPVDDCVPAVAAFFDCRVWGEKSPHGTLRYVFFGLPADVAAARYLYDLVVQAFDTETARFRAGETYGTMPTGVRRTATNSFQIGLARGIAAKLQTLRDARDANLRHVSGRDLVVAKADVVDSELASLGLNLRQRSRSGGRRVLRDVFEEGHQTGLGFEYRPGVGHDG